MISNSETKELLAALAANWLAEMEGFNTYTALMNEKRRIPTGGTHYEAWQQQKKQHADLWSWSYS